MSAADRVAEIAAASRGRGRSARAGAAVTAAPGDVPALLERIARCPWCAASVRPLVGTLQCDACGRATEVRNGIWQAMGPHTAQRTPAQWTNRRRLVARTYERWWRTRSLSLLSGRGFPIREELSELVEWCAPTPGALALDVACSEGLYARELARQQCTVVAVDHSEAFLGRVLERARRQGISIVAVRALAQHLPFADSTFDIVAMGGSLNEIGDRDAAVAEMARVCAMRGRVFSMHLEAAASRPGRVLQRLLGPSGIAFPATADTELLFSRAPLHVERTRRDRVVVRVGARRG